MHVEPIIVDHLDMRCFVTRRELVARHECELMGERGLLPLPGVSCAPRARSSRTCRASSRRSALRGPERPGRLRPRGGPAGARGRVRRYAASQQAYQLGDDVLLTCMACGGTELEVLAARIRFCEPHQVAIGFWYELRCPECNELHYKDDYQFSCPG